MNQPQEQIEDILTAIRKVCPELMELSFGCHLRQAGIDFICIGTMPNGEPITIKQEGAHDPTKQAGAHLDVYKNGKTEIIGHDPHLEHLLRAIDSEHKGNYFIDTEGWLVRNNRLLREQLRKIKIDLTLSLRQNLETNAGLREFIHSLLKV